MHPTSRKSLRDALIACDLILARTEGRTFDESMADPYFRASIERFFEVAGEALRRLERKDPATASVIPDSRAVIDFRNVLAHGYDTVRHDEVWSDIQTDLRPLRDRVAALLGQDDEPGAW